MAANLSYYFGYSLGPNNRPSIEAVKTWLVGNERCFDTLTIAEYETFDDAEELEWQLETLLRVDGVEAALNWAERRAVANGYLDGFRDDPRIFFVNDAPVDQFVTVRQREKASVGGYVR